MNNTKEIQCIKTLIEIMTRPFRWIKECWDDFIEVAGW